MSVSRKALLLGALLACTACVTASPQTELDKRLPWKRTSRRAAAIERRRRAQGTPEAEALEKEAEEADEAMFKWTVVVGILSLAATFIIGQIIESKHITWMPEAGVGVLMGVIASGAAVFLGNDMMLAHEQFDFEFFMVYLLPPIIFEAGFNMNVKAFIDNIGPTMFYAFVGTFASTFIVGGIVWYAGQIGLCYPLGLLASLVFGSLISATDPVTVLAVFQVCGTCDGWFQRRLASLHTHCCKSARLRGGDGRQAGRWGKRGVGVGGEGERLAAANHASRPRQPGPARQAKPFARPRLPTGPRRQG